MMERRAPRWALFAVSAFALLAGAAANLATGAAQEPFEHVHRALCVAPPSRADVVAALGDDLAQLPSDARCEPLLAPGFDPFASEAVVERGSIGDEPLYTVTVRIVDPSSETYRRAAENEFLAVSRMFCEAQNCAPVGMDVFVTPAELQTERIDQLVAVGFGIPRDFCSDPTPQWIQEHKGCVNGVPTR